MDGIQAPRDDSLRNIIDKLAEFVARNGPEFEMMTKQKQQGNQKFDFLFGGEFSQYYQYRVATEQAFLKQQTSLPHDSQPMQQNHGPPSAAGMHQMQPHDIPATAQMHSQQQSNNPHDPSAYPMLRGPPPTAAIPAWNSGTNLSPQQQQQQHTNENPIVQIEALNVQQNKLREQLRSSEANLSAHHSVLMEQQNKDVEEVIKNAQNTQLAKQAEENGISLKEFDAILLPIIESCTKDSISAGKNWILQHSTDSAKNNVVLQYLLKKALDEESTFQQKLHLIYLVNDILHHCLRKNVQDLKNNLENVVIPMFCSADMIATSEQRPKLTRLLSLWESKAKFFDACVISKLQSPESSMYEYHTNLANLHHEVIAKLTEKSKAKFEIYQQQHQVFIQYATQQIAQIEQQKQQLEQEMLATVIPAAMAVAVNVVNLMPTQHLPSPQQRNIPPLLQQKQQQRGLKNNNIPPLMPQPPQQTPQQQRPIPSLMSQKISMPTDDDDDDNRDDEIKPSGVESYMGVGGGSAQDYSNAPPPGVAVGGNPFASQVAGSGNSYGPNDLGAAPANFFIPDLSKPPPGFMGGSGNSGAQFNAHMGNIPINNAGNNALDANPAASNLPVDLVDIKAAIRLIQEQQHLQQTPPAYAAHASGRTVNSIGEASFGSGASGAHHEDDEEPPPPPRMMNNEDNLSVVPPRHMLDEMSTQPTSAAYYDLPAGLIVPLIRLDDCTYKPLDPALIRLPAPAPQDERLTNALAAFYAPPTHERPRDAEGWEKLGLYEYYKVKNGAKKQKEEEIANGTRERSPSLSPIMIENPKPKKISKRCYRSRSRSKSRSPPERSRSRSRSRSPQTNRSRSRERNRGVRNNNSNNNRYNQRNRSSPQRSISGGTDCRDDRGDNRNNLSGNGNANSGSVGNTANSTKRERERSLTPPSFASNNFAKPQEFIEESNKGHQMLMKMGWGGTGTGLGTKNQGINQPILAGEVRDHKDMYKGVGNNLNDPFENFRKNKGAAFVHRMRTRDEKS